MRKGSRKVTLTLYLDPPMAQQLKDLANATHVTQQWYMREGLKRILEEHQRQTQAAA